MARKISLVAFPFALALSLGSLRPAVASDGATDAGAVRQATYSAAQPARSNAAPPLKNEPMPIGPAGRESADASAARGTHRDTPATPSAASAVLSMFGSLAIVIGLFLGLVWLLRRSSPKAVRLVSKEVVELLGRSPLAGRQQMHVVRFGNRLLLVAVSPDGAETLAEIGDPAEVDRLAGLCQQAQANSATQAFRQIFGQLADHRRPSQLDPPDDVAAERDTPIGSRTPVASRQVEDDDV